MRKYVNSSIPSVKVGRSRFDLGHRVLTSGSMGYLYPFECLEVLPGDTFKIDTSVVARLSSTFIKPIFDNIFIDVYFFFVPNRLTWENWKYFMGESKSAWASGAYSVPTLYPQGSKKLSTAQNGANRQVAEGLGFPIDRQVIALDSGGSSYVSPSVLPFRAFAMIYDEFFRDENLISPMNVRKTNSSTNEGLNTNDWSVNNYTGKVPKVAKLHDYFTSALPAPQKGTAPEIPISLGAMPVITSSQWNGLSKATDPGLTGFQNGSFFPDNENHLLTWSSIPVSGLGGFVGISEDESSDVGGIAGSFVPSNLSVPGGTGGFTVNDLRFAVQYQKMLERDARGGTRYIEMIASHFGVQVGDTRVQRPEFLGGKRIPVNVSQVVQHTGYSEDDTPQTLGQLGAYSLSGGRARWTKSFVEHGYVIGVYAIRQFHTYQQGMQRHWYRQARTDFYDPVFASLGEQPVYQYQLFADEDTIAQKSVFGYQEAWAEYRRGVNRVGGQMASAAADTMDVWHLADNYEEAPILGQQFIEETADYLNQAITVEDTAQDQFILDFWVGNIAVRPMPTYSVPGLVDHH